MIWYLSVWTDQRYTMEVELLIIYVQCLLESWLWGSWYNMNPFIISWNHTNPLERLPLCHSLASEVISGQYFYPKVLYSLFNWSCCVILENNDYIMWCPEFPDRTLKALLYSVMYLTLEWNTWHLHTLGWSSCYRVMQWCSVNVTLVQSWHINVSFALRIVIFKLQNPTALCIPGLAGLL